jgi:hypothetical protein
LTKFENRHGSSIESAITTTITTTACWMQLAASVHGGGIDKLLILQLAATDASAVQFPAILDWTPTSLEISADFRLFGFIPPPLPPPI